MQKKWYQSAYCRNVIDMHITDWDEKFLSEFDSEKYVEMLQLSQAESAVVYAHSHVGLCNYPTKVGEMHKGLKGRNILKEVIDLCHQKGIKVVVYYSLIFNDWTYNHFPDWRIITADGKEAAENSRYGVCCPNSPYRDFVVEQIKEICNNYEFEGIRFDMTFWPEVCYCSSCQKRYSEEVGGELPRVVNWEDPKWVTFQRKREEWLIDFAALATSTVKKIKPDVSVEHQSSTYTASWRWGVTVGLSKESDFLQGDFYGNALQGSFVCKLLYNLTENKPFGFETSSNVNLKDHTTLKPKELLEAKAFSALVNGGAFIFIDAIDPVGTLNKRVYSTMGEIYRKIKEYEKYLGGQFCQDVAIYFSTESKFDPEYSGENVIKGRSNILEISDKIPHLDATLSVAKSFINHHIPFGVVTKKNIRELSQYQVLVLPNVLMMDEEEVEAIKNYVKSGGSLYASKYTSLITKGGIRKDNFLLADVFGISYLGETKENFTYISPTEEGKDVFLDYTPKYPLSIYGSQLKIEVKKDTNVLGKIVLPYTDPKDIRRYASIHSNPPGIWTDYPAVVLNRYGKGKVIYVAGDLENVEYHHKIFINLIRLLSRSPFVFESDAPKSVEITAFHQTDKKRYIVNLLNFQEELPNIPINEIKVRIRLGNKRVKRFIILPDERELSYECREDYAEFTAPRLETFLMLALEYE
ncbi:MAG: family 10 glycosylhydrolase [Firmicutes bacterium]|nr:family 10 glycosylhydrolase [Bacillota bacterium]